MMLLPYEHSPTGHGCCWEVNFQCNNPAHESTNSVSLWCWLNPVLLPGGGAEESCLAVRPANGGIAEGGRQPKQRRARRQQDVYEIAGASSDCRRDANRSVRGRPNGEGISSRVCCAWTCLFTSNREIFYLHTIDRDLATLKATNLVLREFAKKLQTTRDQNCHITIHQPISIDISFDFILEFSVGNRIPFPSNHH